MIAPGTQNYTSDRRGNWHFAELSGTHHTQKHSAKVPEETSRAGVNCVEQSVIGQAFDQWRDHLNACVRAKGKYVEHFVVICLPITVNLPWRLMFALLWLYEQIDTCYFSQGSVMTLIRRGG